MKDQTYITRPDLPELESLAPYLEQLWQTRILSNQGEFVTQLEKLLSERLGVEHVALMSSGTMALMAAIKTQSICGSVVTTPFTFAATPQVLTALNLTPIFVDTHHDNFNLDPDRIAEAITPETSAIVPVHTFGLPCEAEAIDAVAKAFELRTIYDGAQAFDVLDNDGAIVRHGDACALSFHATKIFHTFEGGAVVCHDPETYAALARFRNFGIVDETTVKGLGLNGKMSELSAMIGLSMLPLAEEFRSARAVLDAKYRSAIGNIDGLSLPRTGSPKRRNFGYFPILIEDTYPLSVADLRKALLAEGIHARRYFYPLVSQMEAYSGLPSAAPENLPNATKLADQVLCLPIFSTLGEDIQDRIILVLQEPERFV